MTGLEKIVGSSGFHQRCTELELLCIMSATCSVLINDQSLDRFVSARGLRWGIQNNSSSFYLYKVLENGIVLRNLENIRRIQIKTIRDKSLTSVVGRDL